VGVEAKTRTAGEDNASEPRRLFDIVAAAGYLKAIGADAATPNFVRNLISSGQIPCEKIGKKFYISRTALDGWLLSHERRHR
jgi:excisionase family DNA binding protein